VLKLLDCANQTVGFHQVAQFGATAVKAEITQPVAFLTLKVNSLISNFTLASSLQISGIHKSEFQCIFQGVYELGV